MLKDIIFDSTTVETTDYTNLLPYTFLRKYVPLSLTVEDSFDIRKHVPVDIGDFTPRRVFYLDDIDCYLVLDIGNPRMPALYLIDGQTHEFKSSYTYMLDVYPDFQEDDQVADVCVHHSDMRDKIPVTFLVINNTLRRAQLVTFNLEYANIGEESFDEGDSTNAVVHLNLTDVTHFADIIPPGQYDEIALGYTETTANDGHMYGSGTYPKFNVEEIIPILRENLFMGELIPKYCTLTVTEKDQFIILLGTRIKCWM